MFPGDSEMFVKPGSYSMERVNDYFSLASIGTLEQHNECWDQHSNYICILRFYFSPSLVWVHRMNVH